MISGFQAKLAIDDAGTGAAPGGASTAFAGNVTLSLGSFELGKFDATELDQQDPPGTVDPFERERPTGTIKQGTHKGSLKYSKANYQRLQALATKSAAGSEYTVILTTPDDQTTPGTPVTMACTFKCFLSMVGEVQFEKRTPVAIPFEFSVRKKPAFA